ncbi:MAG: hypothetical protein JWP29_3670, partial [Rhodoferax sp.]|nr:hypothetical protein [Rhodoferax sp.]
MDRRHDIRCRGAAASALNGQYPVLTMQEIID